MKKIHSWIMNLPLLTVIGSVTWSDIGVDVVKNFCFAGRTGKSSHHLVATKTNTKADYVPRYVWAGTSLTQVDAAGADNVDCTFGYCNKKQVNIFLYRQSVLAFVLLWAGRTLFFVCLPVA